MTLMHRFNKAADLLDQVMKVRGSLRCMTQTCGRRSRCLCL